MSNKKPDGEAAFNKLFYMYKVNAKSRHLSFSLSKKKFKELTKLSCHYCGVEPSQEAFQYSGHGKSTPYTYNGVDRINNKQGYTKNNVVPCCKICNQAKLNMPLSEFLLWIKRLVAYCSQST